MSFEIAHRAIKEINHRRYDQTIEGDNFDNEPLGKLRHCLSTSDVSIEKLSLHPEDARLV